MLNKTNFNPSFQGTITIYKLKKVKVPKITKSIESIENFVTTPRQDLIIKQKFNSIVQFDNYRPVTIDKTKKSQNFAQYIESIIGKELNWNNSDKKLLMHGGDDFVYYGDDVSKQNEGIHANINFD